MEVICITNKSTSLVEEERRRVLLLLEIGKKYTVVNILENKYYFLKEIAYCPFSGKRVCFQFYFFSRLSDKDETELSHAKPIESTFTLKEV